MLLCISTHVDSLLSLYLPIYSGFYQNKVVISSYRTSNEYQPSLVVKVPISRYLTSNVKNRKSKTKLVDLIHLNHSWKYGREEFRCLAKSAGIFQVCFWWVIKWFLLVFAIVFLVFSSLVVTGCQKRSLVVGSSLVVMKILMSSTTSPRTVTSVSPFWLRLYCSLFSFPTVARKSSMILSLRNRTTEME